MVMGGRVVITPDSEHPYKVVLEHATGATSEIPVPTVRHGEAIVRESLPSPENPQGRYSALLDDAHTRAQMPYEEPAHFDGPGLLSKRRKYRVIGTDELGDLHIVATDDPGRAAQAAEAMRGRCRDVELLES